MNKVTLASGEIFDEASFFGFEYGYFVAAGFSYFLAKYRGASNQASSGSGRPGGSDGASNEGGVSGVIRVTPGSSLAGERLTLTVVLDANGHLPLPPTQIRPSGVLIGNSRLTAIARPTRTSTRGTMRIPIDTEKGKKDVTVVFPEPSGRGEIRFVGKDLFEVE